MLHDRIIKVKELVKITGRSRTSLWRDQKEGKLPRPKRTGKRSIGWKSSDIQKYIDDLEYY